MDILFVCTGNTCRSPMAEAYFKSLCQKSKNNSFHVHSAGTFAAIGCPASENSTKVMKKHNIDLSKHQSSMVTIEKLEKSDSVVCMTESHRQQLLAFAPQISNKLSLILDHLSTNPGGNVADPVGGDLQLYNKCFEEMKPALDNLFLDLSS